MGSFGIQKSTMCSYYSLVSIVALCLIFLKVASLHLFLEELHNKKRHKDIIRTKLQCDKPHIMQLTQPQNAMHFVVQNNCYVFPSTAEKFFESVTSWSLHSRTLFLSVFCIPRNKHGPQLRCLIITPLHNIGNVSTNSMS